jgi:hypothetical protein
MGAISTPHRQIVPYLTFRPTIKPKQALRGKLGRGPSRGAGTHTLGFLLILNLRNLKTRHDVALIVRSHR